MQQQAVCISFYCNIPLHVSGCLLHPSSGVPKTVVRRCHVEVDSCPFNGQDLTDFMYHVTETHDLYQWL
jgi:hypothetical protein